MAADGVETQSVLIAAVLSGRTLVVLYRERNTGSQHEISITFIQSALYLIAMFPSPCYNVHFQVSLEERVMETPNFD